MAIRSIVHFERLLTDQEVALIDSRVSDYIASGKTVSIDPEVITYNGAPAYTRVFDDATTAQDFVDFLKTYSPGPVTALVENS